MIFNRIKGTPVDPFISHMRITYEENMRKETERYWRDKIASEIMYRNLSSKDEIIYLIRNGNVS